MKTALGCSLPKNLDFDSLPPYDSLGKIIKIIRRQCMHVVLVHYPMAESIITYTKRIIDLIK